MKEKTYEIEINKNRNILAFSSWFIAMGFYILVLLDYYIVSIPSTIVLSVVLVCPLISAILILICIFSNDKVVVRT